MQQGYQNNNVEATFMGGVIDAQGSTTIRK